MTDSVNGKTKANQRSGDADALQTALRFLRLLRYQKQYILAACLVAILLASLYYFTTPRIYEASASLLITNHGTDVVSSKPGSTSGRDSLMPTYERVFTSAVVVDGALRRLQQMPAEMRVDFATYPQKQWADVLKQNLRARALLRANIIDIRYRSKSPVAGEAVVQSVVASYQDFMEEHHKDVSAEVVKILDIERRDIEAQLAAKQAQLLQVKHTVRALGLDEGANTVHPAVQRVIQLNETLVEVQKERLRLQAVSAAIHASIQAGEDLRQHLITLDPSIGHEIVLHELGLSPQLAEAASTIERQMLENRTKLQILYQHFGSRHPDVAETEQAIRNAEQYLASIRGSRRLEQLSREQLAGLLTSMVKQRLDEVSAHEIELTAQYAKLEDEAVGLNDRMAELQVAQNEMQRLRNLYDTLLNRISSVDINQNHNDVRVAVISEPTAADRAVAPRLAFVVLAALLGGLGGGATLVYLLDLLDDRFRSPEELQEQLGLPLLALVPELPQGEGTGIDAVQLHVAPTEVESEAFRTLRTTLSFAGAELDRLAITSSEPGDGKTTLLANLAVAYAQAGKRTLLIDADLRRPGLSKLLDMRGSGGLAEVLRSEGEIEEACRHRIQPVGAPGLDVLPCGARPADPAELLSRARLAELIAWAEDSYDQVLIDCPPMLVASDAALVGRLVDGVMLVVQPQKNRRRAVFRAAQMLTSLGIHVAGFVANLVGGEDQSGYYGYSSDYGYGLEYADEEQSSHLQLPPPDDHDTEGSRRRAA